MESFSFPPLHDSSAVSFTCQLESNIYVSGNLPEIRSEDPCKHGYIRGLFFPPPMFSGVGDKLGSADKPARSCNELPAVETIRCWDV